MTHTQWNAQIKRALAISEKNPDAAVRLLERLARTITSETGTGLQQWHLAQTLGVTSSVQSESGKHRQAADTMLRVAEHHEQDLRYHQRALVSAFAVSAMELAQGGDLRGAAKMLKRAQPFARTLRPKEKLLQHAQKAVRAMPRGI
jgi:hypothetical protein